ncbi:MAG: PspC domain-containing protein [Treponema sp.]|nr:PspC domain-containing protein [Treponema sp.]
MKKRLYRSNNKKLAGVCAGIAEYFDIDPTVIRLLWVLLTCISIGFPGLLVYIVCAVVIPNKDEVKSVPSDEEVYGMKDAKVDEE